ncbi:glycosyltransferase family 4 protein [Streptomyces sp. t39]|uniref:glycosyltransferase family 4 protein n=1 Tax=Streptomyces sp. t39 TaxID=1828156 RepID=UPI0011CD9765|nr:glycosyltransferase family 4 protein [Streptomyces sp. t39]TXS42885.1 glycosyltransferase family 1 protein [Streptomyces sp. t39]
MATVFQISAYYPPHLGGIERVVENLASGLGEGHDVRVVTTTLDAGTEPRRSREGRVTVRRHRAVEFAHTPFAPGIFAALLRAPRDAVLHVHTAYTFVPEAVAVAARLRGRSYVVHHHLDVDASGRFGLLLPAYKKHVLGRVMRGAAAVIVLTDAQADFVRGTYGVRAERVFTVPNGVDDAFYLPVREAAEGPLRLLFVGRLSPQKNVGRLLDALRLVRRPVELCIVGDGEQRAELAARTRSLGLGNVTFAGPLFGRDLIRAYARAGAFVLPSEKEGMALVALEAMAAALPVIATDVPGNTELLTDVGLLTAPEPAALAAAIDRLAADPELCFSLSVRSARAARRYTWQRTVSEVEAVYAKALS